MGQLLRKSGIFLLICVLPSYYAFKVFFSGFLSNDDASIAISRFEHGNSIWGSSYDIAQSTGRFYQAFFYALSQLPYLTPQSLLQFSIGAWRSFFILLFFAVVYRFSRHFFSERLARIAIFLTAISIDFSGWYNSLVSYPFWISLGICSILLSAISLDKYLESHSRRDFFAFAFLSFIGVLSYEALLTSIILYIFVFLRKLQYSQLNFYTSLKQNWKIFAFYASMLTSYCILYVTFRKLVDGKYAGAELGSLNPKVLFNTLLQESLLHSALKRLFIDDRGFFNFRFHIFPLESTLVDPKGALITAGLFLATLMLIWTIQNRNNSDLVQKRVIKFNLIWLVCLFLMPNFLLAFSKMQQSSADNSPYTMSLFSIVFLNLLISTSLTSLFAKTGKNTLNRIVKQASGLIVVLVFSATSSAQIKANISYVSDRSEVSQIWEILDSDDMSYYLKTDPEIIYSKSIPRITRTDGYPFWHFYLGKTDPNFMTNDEKSSDFKHLEAIKSNCGYVLVLIHKQNILKTFQIPGCEITKVNLTTSDYQFSGDITQILKKEWSMVEVSE